MENIINIIDSVDNDIDKEVALKLLTNDKNLFNIIKELINNENYKKTIINYFIINNSFSNLLFAYFELTNKDIDIWLNENEMNVRQKPLTKKETNELIYRYQNYNDQEARKKLYEHNIGLIKKIASVYKYKANIEFEDLFQEGSIGFLYSLDRFDPSKDKCLTTYASYWIKHSINKYITLNHSSIRQSFNSTYLFAKIKRYQELLINKYGRYPTVEEISENLDIPVNQVEMIINSNYSMVSLDDPIFKEDNSSFINNIPDVTIDVEDDALTNVEYEEIIDNINKVLNYRDAQILILKKGLCNNKEHTLDELTNIFHVSRETIRKSVKKSERILKDLYLKGKKDTNSKNIPVKTKEIPYPITEIFDASIENILYVVSNLEPDQIAIMKEAFGPELNKKLTEDVSDTEKLYNTLIIINMMLQYEKTDKYIYENVIISNKKEIKEIIDDNHLNIFYKKFGTNLNEKNNINDKERLLLIKSYMRIISYINNIYQRNKSLYDWYPDSTKQEVITAVRCLKIGHKIIVYKRFGYNLDGLYPISHNEACLFHTCIKKKIKEYLDNKKMTRSFS